MTCHKSGHVAVGPLHLDFHYPRLVLVPISQLQEVHSMISLEEKVLDLVSNRILGHGSGVDFEGAADGLGTGNLVGGGKFNKRVHKVVIGWKRLDLVDKLLRKGFGASHCDDEGANYDEDLKEH